MLAIFIPLILSVILNGAVSPGWSQPFERLPVEATSDWVLATGDLITAATSRRMNNGEMDLNRAMWIVEQRFTGQILRAETQIENGQPVHHIRILTPDGRVLNLRVDSSGRIIEP